MDPDDYQPPKKRMKLGGKKKTQKNDVVDSKKKPCPPVVDFMTMNDQCILKVFQYLSISDLFILCEMSSRLKNLLSQEVLNERLFDFDVLSNIGYERVFAMFGKYMVNIKIGEKHVQNAELNHSKFDEILHQIQKHCAKEGLKHVDFEFCNSTTIVNDAVLKDTLAFFRNVESFKMNEPKNTQVFHHFERGGQYMINESVNNFIDSVVMNATKIKSAKFENFRVNGGWLSLEHMKNMKILSFINCHLEKNPCLIAFMQKKPALDSFIWRNSSVDRVNDSANFILGLVGNNLPHLKVLNFTRNLGCFEKNVYVAEKNIKSINPNFLTQSNKLKELTISFEHNNSPAFQFSIGHLTYLVLYNSIEKLSISLNMIGWHNTDLYYLNHFTSLKCVEITGGIYSIFYCKFLSNLPNFKELRLSFNHFEPDQLYDFLRSAKKISILKLEAPMSKFSIQVYSNILQIRLNNLVEEPSDEPLQVYIDQSPLDAFIEKLKKKYKPNIVSLVPLK